MTTTIVELGPGCRPRVQDVDRHIGARLRQRRLELGLSPRRLAELVGVSYQQAYKYEAGVNRISAGRLHVTARALGVELGYFFEGLEAGRPSRPTARQRQVLELADTFAALPQREQEALLRVARTLAGSRADAGTAREGGGPSAPSSGGRPPVPTSEHGHET
jgi:transcriptional regulator with XRE-family HTH domain